MGLIAKWKLRREVYRIKEQLAARLAIFYEPLLKKRHDTWRKKQPEPQNLEVVLGDKVAIFLIYQPKGIAPSVFATLRWLIANGYAPLIISNLPISSADRDALNGLAWRVFERPNFGYDFGGYRDGVLLLKTWGILPERLLILNDSVWMPTRADSTLIARLEDVQADIAGGIMQAELQRSMNRTRRAYLESYLYLVNRSGFLSETFLDFWKKYPTSSHKRNAVLRGERQLTYRMIDGGLKVVGLFSLSAFLEENARQDNSFLRKVLRYAAYINPTDKAENQGLLQRYLPSKEWQAAAMNHIKSTAAVRRFNAVFPFSADVLFGMDFIKKAPGSIGKGTFLHSQMRRQFLLAVSEGNLRPLAPEVQFEIEAVEKKIG